MSVVTRWRAPARIDLAGGTLDVPPLCFVVESSLTLNVAIDLVSDVAITRREGQPNRVIANGIEVTEQALFRHVFDWFGWGAELDVAIETQIPRASGLGGSSVLLVALFRALWALRSEGEPTLTEWLDGVTFLEHRLLGKPAGTQDAIAAISGGCNWIQFHSGRPEWVRRDIPPFLAGPLYLLYTNEQHHSGINNWSIIKAACEGDRRIMDRLSALAVNANQMKRYLEVEDMNGFLDALRIEADIRAGLAPDLVPEMMQRFCERLGDRGVGKMCGAGGGGCMFLFGPDLERVELEHLSEGLDLQVLEVHASHGGCREVKHGVA